MRKSKYNFTEIQSSLDSGMSWLEVVEKHKISRSYLAQCIQEKKLSSCKTNKNQHRNGFQFSDETKEKLRQKATGKKLSLETKEKISKSRIKYLLENPDKVPYVLNHSSKPSWPEEVFKNALISFGIEGWVYKYRHSIYEYDFAFPDLKLDIEVDGGTHKTEKVKKIDKRRDEFSRQQGWTVLRFEAERVKKDVVSCIEELKILISVCCC